MRLIHYPDRASQASTLAALVASQLQTAITQHGVARLALSGGVTPQMFLAELDKTELVWENVRLTLTDERQVAANHPRSNLRFVCSHLPAVAQRLQRFPLYAAEDGQMDVAALTRLLEQHILPLDVCVLGMGADGHFASLFADADTLPAALDPGNRTPVLPIHTPSQPEARVSLTLSALLSSAQLHLLIQGADKRQVLETARPPLPIAALLKQAGDRLLVHYAD